jgi:PAS domain S-box-containing protein
MLKVTLSQLKPYGVAVLSVAIAFLLTLLLQPLLTPTIFLLFYPAVMVSALQSAMRSAILASILSTLVCKYFFLAPLYSLTIPNLNTGVRLVVFLLVMLMIGGITTALGAARRRAEVSLLKLQESQERYRILAENIPQLVWLARADGFVDYFNQRWIEYTGLKSNETLGWDWQRAIHPEDLPSTLEHWKTALATGNSVEVQYRLKRADGIYRWHIIRAVPLRDPKGEIVNWLGTCTDIHDPKQVEEERIQLLEALESKQRLLEAVLQQMPAGVMVAEAPSERLVLMNEQVQQILHGPFLLVDRVEDYIQYQLLYPDGRLYTQEQTPLARSLRTGEIVREEELDIICGDGIRRTLLTSSTPIRDTEGCILAAVLTFYDITERKQARERIQLHADVVKNVQVGIVVWQLEDLETPDSFRLITANLAAKQVTGLDFEALIGTTMGESFPALMETQLPREYVEVVRTGQAKDLGEVRYGDERVVEGMYSLKAFPLPNHCFGLAFENITAAKKVEQELGEALQRLNFHVENTPLAVIERDRNFKIKRWSQGAQRIFGWQAEEVIGKGPNDLQLVHIEDIGAVTNLRIRLLSGIEKHNISRNRSYTKDGSVVHCEWYNSALLDESGNLVSVMSLVLDITERERAAAALRESNRRVTNILESITDAFVALDEQWRITYVNGETARLNNTPPEEMIGKTHWEMWPWSVGTRVEQEYHRAVAEQIAIHFEVLYEPSNRWLDIHAYPSVDGLNIYFRDITERKQAEVERMNLLEQERAARAEAEAANRIKDEFLAVLSHELRSPLNPILGWSKLLQTRKFDEAATRRALETIERNAKLQIQLIEDLLDVSRILQGKLSLNICPIDLVSTIEAALETVQLAASAKSIEIRTVLEPNVGQVLGDSGRLQQVVWNLLSNAVKFTPTGGRVEVRLSSSSEAILTELDSSHSKLKTQNSALSTQHSALIQVRDTGKGINPDFLPYVFDYFRQENSTTTRSFGGLGLGLAIVRHLVELHGGTVSAESLGEGQGATFSVWLPLMTTQLETNSDSRQSDQDLDLKGIRVLVVDDEVDMREFLAFMLEEYGAEVTVVASASEALEALPQVKPDILLSDIGMPEVDGHMLIRQIRAMTPEQGGKIPAIALTAYAGEADQTQALAAGFQRHIAKPVEPNELAAVVACLAR